MEQIYCVQGQLVSTVQHVVTFRIIYIYTNYFFQIEVTVQRLTLCFSMSNYLKCVFMLRRALSLQRRQAFRLYLCTASVVLLSSQLTCFCALCFQCARVHVCNVAVLQNNMCLGNKMTLWRHWAFCMLKPEDGAAEPLASLTHTNKQQWGFKTLFHPVNLNVTSTQYTGK